MPEEMSQNGWKAGVNYARKKRRRGILERLGLKNPSEEDDDEEDVPGMRYENTRFGNGKQNDDETSNPGIGDVGEMHAEDYMIMEMERRAHKKLKRMEKEAGTPWGFRD